MGNHYDKSMALKMLISQAKALEKNVDRTLNDSATEAHSRYVSFKSYAETYNRIARESEKVLGLPANSFPVFYTDKMGSYMDTL